MGYDPEIILQHRDHDGTLSLDEVKNAANARFNALDAITTAASTGGSLAPRVADNDHDGTLDSKEFKSGPGRFCCDCSGKGKGRCFSPSFVVTT
jgi:hypothetical protein